MQRLKSFTAHDEVSHLQPLLRGVAVTFIYIHHWLLYVPVSPQNELVSHALFYLRYVAGSFVHLFFILSGYGLTRAHFTVPVSSWTHWACRRLVKIMVPYWLLVVVSFVLLNACRAQLPERMQAGYTWFDLLAYVALFRNSYPPCWDMNYTLWFVPVIVGLYLSFPVLISVLHNYGKLVLLSICVVASWLSIAVSVELKPNAGHQADWFLYYAGVFATGIVAASAIHARPGLCKRVFGLMGVIAGIVAYALSFAIKSWVPHGDCYNDVFTAVGLFLIIVNVVHGFDKLRLESLSRILRKVGQLSFVIYLIHYPLIVLTAQQCRRFGTGELGLSFLLFGGAAVYVAIVILSWWISRPLDALVDWSAAQLARCIK